LCLDIGGPNGPFLIVNTCSNSSTQEWQLGTYVPVVVPPVQEFPTPVIIQNIGGLCLQQSSGALVIETSNCQTSNPSYAFTILSTGSTFTISALSIQESLDYGSSPINERVVSTVATSGGASQQWTITKASVANYWNIMTQNGLCLNVNGQPNGPFLMTYTCNVGNVGHQQWQFVPYVPPVVLNFTTPVMIQNIGGPCLRQNGTFVSESTDCSMFDPLYSFVINSSGQLYTIQSSKNGVSLDYSSSPSNEKAVSTVATTGGASQQWTINPSSVANYYNIITQNNLCLDIDGEPNGPFLMVFQCLGNSHQQWQFVPYISKINVSSQIKTSTGQCLQYIYQNYQIIQIACDSTNEYQAFTAEYFGSWGFYIHTSFGGRAMDANACNGPMQTPIIANTYSSNTCSQNWYGKRNSDGSYTFVLAQAETTCMEIHGTSFGSLLQTNTCNGSPNQSFSFIPL